MKSTLLLVLFSTGAAACGVDSLPMGDLAPGADAAGGGGGADGGGDVADNRVTEGLQALYRFQGTAGQATVTDVSAVGTPLDLTLADPAAVTWDLGGMTFVTPSIASYAAPPAKINEACQLSNEITLEAWVQNSTLTDANGRIVSSAVDAAQRNFQLKQQNDSWQGRVRTAQNINGEDDAILGSATLQPQHIVWTRDSLGVSYFFIDGAQLAPSTVTGAFSNWDLTYGLYVGNEPTLDCPWLGTVFLVAVYCTEFDQDMVEQNMAEGY